MNVASVSLDGVLRPRHGCSAPMTARPFLPPQQSASSSWPVLQGSVRRAQARVAAPSFLALFAIVGLALYGLPFFYDFMVRDFGWSRAQVTSGNALSKLLVGPLFGFLAGWMVDRFGPRRLMVAGILMAGIALVGLGMIHTLAGFYLFYLFNALGNVCGGPLPNQVLLSRWFTAARGRAMGCGEPARSEEHTSELQSRLHLVCRLLLEKKKTTQLQET